MRPSLSPFQKKSTYVWLHSLVWYPVSLPMPTCLSSRRVIHYWRLSIIVILPIRYSLYPLAHWSPFLLLWPFLRDKLPSRFLYLYCFAGYLFSGFIDACTSYGTYLLWPASNERISWNIISIVDPRVHFPSVTWRHSRLQDFQYAL